MTLWQLDPLRGSAFIPLPRILAGMHPVDAHADRRGKYIEHMGKYEFFSSLSFPVPLQAVESFALRNNMSIDVYGVDDDNEVIYPHRISSTFVLDRHTALHHN